MNPQPPDAPPIADETPPHADAAPSRLPSAPAFVILAVVLTLLAAALAVSATAQWSLTYDEPAHITYGYSDCKTGDFRLSDHPPLAHYLMALPLLPLKLAAPFCGQKWDLGDGFAVAERFFAPPNDAQQITIRARLVVVVIWLAGAWIVWAWSRRLFGSAGAAISISLYLFYPDFMTHGSLATTDMPATVAFLAALYALALLVERVTFGRALAFTLAASAVILTKYTGLLIAPVFVLVALIVIVRRRGRRALVFSGVAAGTFVMVLVAVWAAYGFRYRAALDAPDDASYSHMLVHGDTRDPRLSLSDAERSFLIDTYGRDNISLIEQLTYQHPLMRVVVSAADRNHLLPEAYLYGLATTIRRGEQRSAYLMGRTSVNGWWYYFPVAALLKTPTAVLVTMLLAGVAYRRRALKDSSSTSSSFLRDSLTVILVFEVVYWLTSMTAHLNIGHRHLLPVYPPLFVLCGAAAVWLRSPRKLVRAAPLICVAAVLATNVLTWPNDLGYFTELIGGSRNGAWYLTDSNIDWGQDLIHLDDYLDRHADEQPRDTVKLAYFGSADPAWYGLGDVSVFETAGDPPADEMSPHERPADFSPGTYVISATTLSGVYLKPQFQHWSDTLQRDLDRRELALRSALAGRPLPDGVTTDSLAADLRQLHFIKLISKIRTRPPDAIVGSSLFVYNLDDHALGALLQE